MKKAKVMLLAIAVFATVGGALAFKVKKVGELQYVYSITDTEPTRAKCTLTDESATMLENGSITIYYTETTNVGNAGNLDCPNVAHSIID